MTNGWRPSALVLGMLGMSQEEAVEYLKSRGIKVSLGAVKAWGRGHYAAPLDALRELWVLWLSVYGLDKEIPIPPEAPLSVWDRQRDIKDLRDLFTPVYDELVSRDDPKPEHEVENVMPSATDGVGFSKPVFAEQLSDVSIHPSALGTTVGQTVEERLAVTEALLADTQVSLARLLDVIEEYIPDIRSK